MSAEDVAVGRASLFDCVLKGPRNVLLSDDLGELLRTVFARQDGVAHEEETSIIRDGREARLNYEIGILQLSAPKHAMRKAGSHRVHVSPRPRTKIKSRLTTVAVAIHPALRSIAPTRSSLPLHLRIRLGRLSKPAFAPSVEGNAEAIT